MIIRCPSCGREGNIPDTGSRPFRNVRCRPCGARFALEIAARIDQPYLLEPATNGGLLQHGLARPMVAVERASAIDDLDLMNFPDRSLPDSEDDFAGVLGGDPDDSQVELPAFTSGEPLSGEIDAFPPFEPAGSDFLLPAPWYNKFIESWGQVHFFFAVGFAAFSLLILGVLLITTLVAGRTVSSSITALIVGFVATVAFLLLSISATMLFSLLVDLARNVRVLIQQSERGPGRPIDAKNQTRAGISQPVG